MCSEGLDYAWWQCEKLSQSASVTLSPKQIVTEEPSSPARVVHYLCEGCEPVGNPD